MKRQDSCLLHECCKRKAEKFTSALLFLLFYERSLTCTKTHTQENVLTCIGNRAYENNFSKQDERKSVMCIQ